MLIINADDWGGWKSATDAALACYQHGRISSVSAMVFMEDSERAARLARDAGVDVGLHANFTQPFTSPDCPGRLSQDQNRIRAFLKMSRYAQILYHPLLRPHFRNVYQAQADEFQRLYGYRPSHVDGHQHMHLSANMLIDRIIPAGEKVRRSFSFWPGEKGLVNRTYRGIVDRRLARIYRVTRYFFALAQCLRGERFRRVIDLAKVESVELMTHPEKHVEHACLMSDNFLAELTSLNVGSYSLL